MPMKVATIGFFDGVHLGHQYLLSQVVDEAQRMHGIAACVSFVNHPREVIEKMQGNQISMPLLTTAEEKSDLMRRHGVEEVHLMPFTPELAMMSAHDFMSSVLRNDLGVDTLVIGYDHRFGHHRSEGFDDYVRYGNEIGMKVMQAKAFQRDYITVSSSLIRESLLQGRISESRKLLGYDYSVDGVVVGGFKVGRQLGYPTANISLPAEKLIPCDGVYAVSIEIEKQTFGGMLNIGWRPTFGGNQRSIEVHLFDFHSDLYNHHITIHFMEWLRAEKKFSSPDLLIRQLSFDEQQARRILSDKCV